MGAWLKKLFSGRIISSLFYLALGLLLVLMPDQSVNIICKIVFGVVLILTGVYHVLIHLFEQNNATILDLFSGVILIVLGVFLFMNPLLVIKVFPILLGGFVLVDSIWTLKGAFTLKRRNRSRWKFLFFFSLVFLGLGAALIWNPFTVVKQMIIFAGCVLTANGALDLFFALLIFLGIRKADKLEKKQAEEAEKKEKEETTDFVVEENSYEDWDMEKAGESSEKEESIGEITLELPAEEENADA